MKSCVVRSWNPQKAILITLKITFISIFKSNTDRGHWVRYIRTLYYLCKNFKSYSKIKSLV